MSATITIDGVDKTANLVRLELREEYCDPGKHVEAVFDSFFAVDTWKSLVIYEDATLLFTGNTSQIEANRPDGTFLVRGADDIKRLHEYFVAEDYIAGGEGVQHWVRKFAEEAGCSITFLEDYDPIPLQGMTFGRMAAWEIIIELLLYAGWDIWCEPDGEVQVGLRLRDRVPTETIEAGDNLTSMERSEDSEPPRNCATVWAATGYGTAYRKFGWEIDDDDVRTMVVSSMYIKNAVEAFDLANRLVSVGGPTYDIKRCELDDIYPDIEIGDYTNFDNGEGESGKDDVTSVTSVWDGNSGNRTMSVKLGERCPLTGAGGAGGSPIDGRDVTVATFECGVWRCLDIWEDTPRWYSLNTGIESSYSFDGHDYGSGFNCEWFIRDPFKPNDLAFLHTYAGILQTNSQTPGYENWFPVKMNYEVGDAYGLGGVATQLWHIARIRSTIARQGAYWFVAQYGGHILDISAPWNFVGLTNDGFQTIHGGPTATGNYCCADPPPSASDIYSSWLWGGCNWGHQWITALPTWHRSSAYIGAGGGGGLAPWHKNDYGCTIAGVQSAIAANGGPTSWNCQRGTELGYAPSGCAQWCIPDEMVLSPKAMIFNLNAWACFGAGGPLDPPWPIAYFPMDSGGITYNEAADWLKISSPHIPYKQEYVYDVVTGRWSPSIVYFTPGLWVGSNVETTAAFPTRNATPLYLPWGSAPADCHLVQDSIESYTQDSAKIYCFSYGNPSRFAFSDDSGSSWEERDSVPFATSCFSGFPYSAQKQYVGRDPIRDPSAPAPPPYSTDRDLIAATWDRGATWHDVTGDLWTQTRDMHIRQVDGTWLGSAGLVTIAPRYC